MQPDPVGYAGGINLYAYVLNDPVNWVDPLGLYIVCRPVAITTSGSEGVGTVTGIRCYDNGIDISRQLRASGGGGRSGGGGGGGGDQKDDKKEETPECKQKRQSAETAKLNLPSYISRANVWDNASLLRGELANVQANLSDAQALAWVFGGVSGSTILGGLRSVAERGWRGVSPLAIAGLAYGTWATSTASEYQKQADAIQARLNELKAQQDGTCPN